MDKARKSLVLATLTNAGILAVAWILPVLARRLGVPDWLPMSIVKIVVSVGLCYVALRLSARVALYVLSVAASFLIVETVVHSVYGIDKVQGFPSHMSIYAAVMLGLLVDRFLLAAPRSEATA